MATMSACQVSLTANLLDFCSTKPELNSFSPALQPVLCPASPTSPSVPLISSTPTLSSTSVTPTSVCFKCQTQLAGGVDSNAAPHPYRPYLEQTIDHQPILETEIVHHPILYPHSTSTPLSDPNSKSCVPPERACRCELFPEAEPLKKSGAAVTLVPASRQPTFQPFSRSVTPSLSSLGIAALCEALTDPADDPAKQGPLLRMDDQDTEGQGNCSDGEEDKTEATSFLECSDTEEDGRADALDGPGDVVEDEGHQEDDPAREFESPFTKNVTNCSQSQGRNETKDHFGGNNNYEGKNGNRNNFRGGKNKNNKYNKRGGGGGNQQGGQNNYNRNKKKPGQNWNNYCAGSTAAASNLLVDLDGAPNDNLDQGDGVSLVDPAQGQGRSNIRGGPAPWGVGTANLFGHESHKKVGCGGGGGAGGGGGGNGNSNNNKNNATKSNGGNNNNQYKKSDNNSNNNGNNNSAKPGGGGGEFKWDALSRHVKQLCYNIGLLRRASTGPGYTLDSLCLHCHHRGLVFFFLLCYLVIACNWFTGEQILCYENSKAAHSVTGHYREICLSYVYVQADEVGPRRYLMFYRYLHYCLLLAAGLSYVLRCGYVKKWEDPRLGRLWADVWKDRQNYESSRWRESSDRVLQYLLSGQPSVLHYYKWILCHLLTNLLDVALMLYFDFLLQGNFLRLVPETLFSLQRDPATFTDRLSTLFPPFVDCEITKVHKITSNSAFTYGCHLTLMELYEKVFILAWLVLVFHWLWSLLMVVWLVLGLLPCVGKLTFIVAGGLAERRSFRAMCRVVKLCSLGDIHVLYLMKRWMSNVQFLALLDEVVKSKEEQLVERLGQRHKPALMALYPIEDQKNTAIQMEPDYSQATRDVLYFYKSGQSQTQDESTQQKFPDLYASAPLGVSGSYPPEQTDSFGVRRPGWTVPVQPPLARWPSAEAGRHTGQHWTGTEQATGPQLSQLEHVRRPQVATALPPPPESKEPLSDAVDQDYMLRNRTKNAHRGYKP